jgi:hypothetical protein
MKRSNYYKTVKFPRNVAEWLEPNESLCKNFKMDLKWKFQLFMASPMILLTQMKCQDVVFSSLQPHEMNFVKNVKKKPTPFK